MDPETIGIIVAVIGTGIALWRVNKTSMDRLHTDISDVRNDIGGLRERMARLEGMFEGFTGTRTGAPTAGD